MLGMKHEKDGVMRVVSQKPTMRGFWCVALCIAASGLGCVFTSGDGDGLFDPYEPDSSDGEWQQDVEDRREQRDNPRSADYRGDFEVELESELFTLSIDGAALGEATFVHVGQDLAGTPPHCQLTLADREPDAAGRQGYIIVQVLGDSCDLDVGVYDVYESVDEAFRNDGKVAVKTVQVNEETDSATHFYTFGAASGELEVLQVDAGSLIQAYLDVKMGEVEVDDKAAVASSMTVLGGFGAVAAP